MSPRTGRPTDNPKTVRITVRLDAGSVETLDNYCANIGVDRAEAIREGIRRLKAGPGEDREGGGK